MNRTARLALVPALVLLYSGATFGQITDVMKKAPNADANAIQRYVDAAVKNLTTDDPEKQAKGREDLVAGVVLPATDTAQLSPVFADAYAGAVAKALAPLTTHEDMRVRLNAAIVNARVAERVGNTRLQDVTVKFINDKTSAVALWGVKAARAMLPAILAQGNDKNPLLVALVQAVQRVGFGPIVNEVYEALSLNYATQKPPPNVLKGAIPEMLHVFRARVDGYGSGSAPPDPGIDNTAPEFFSFSTVWQQMTPQQRTEAVQAMTDLLSYVGQMASLMEGDERAPLIPVFKRTGAALQVIGDAGKNSALSKAAQDIQKISTGMDSAEVGTRTTALTTAVKTAFPGVKPSPQLQPPPEPAEATAPPEEPAPAKDGKAPPPPGGATTGAPTGAPRGNQSKSAAPASDADSAQTAGDAQPAEPGTANQADNAGLRQHQPTDQPPPQRPTPPAPGRPQR